MFEDVEGGEAAGAGEVVAAEAGGVDDAAVEAGIDFLVDGAAGDDGSGGDVACGEGFGEGDDVGLEVPVFEGEPFACAAEAGLDFVADEECAVVVAEGLCGWVVVVGGVVDAFALDEFEDEGGDVAFFEFGFEGLEVAEGDVGDVGEEGAEAFVEEGVGGDG